MSDNAQPSAGPRNGQDDNPPPRDDAADQARLDELGSWTSLGPQVGAAPPANNVMLHAYGALNERHTALLREMKDSGLGLWNLLRLADESGSEDAWNSRELEQAAARLEESLMWAEKHFVM
jgi:hypothetical protein